MYLDVQFTAIRRTERVPAWLALPCLFIVKAKSSVWSNLIDRIILDCVSVLPCNHCDTSKVKWETRRLKIVDLFPNCGGVRKMFNKIVPRVGDLIDWKYKQSQLCQPWSSYVVDCASQGLNTQLYLDMSPPSSATGYNKGEVSCLLCCTSKFGRVGTDPVLFPNVHCSTATSQTCAQN